MLECISLKKKDIEILEELNTHRFEFNELNENFFDLYNDSNYAQQVLLRNRIKILKHYKDIIGFIYYKKINLVYFHIESMYIYPGKFELEGYKKILDSLGKSFQISYDCKNNGKNFKVLSDLGFTKDKGTLNMVCTSLNNIPTLEDEEINFETFAVGRHEALRCELQNSIFRNSKRIPLTIQDIFYDENQSYYLNSGSIFIKKEDTYIGYGQIILENNGPLIVNFGITKQYRGKCYGRKLLAELLKIVKNLGYEKVSINVKSENTPAIKLYKNMGFNLVGENYKFILKK